MKEATGELSMTVVVIIAVIAIVAIVSWLFVGDKAPARTWIENQWNNLTSEADSARGSNNG